MDHELRQREAEAKRRKCKQDAELRQREAEAKRRKRQHTYKAFAYNTRKKFEVPLRFFFFFFSKPTSLKVGRGA